MVVRVFGGRLCNYIMKIVHTNEIIMNENLHFKHLLQKHWFLNKFNFENMLVLHPTLYLSLDITQVKDRN